MAKTQRTDILEPKIAGRPISLVKSEESLTEAREEYKNLAGGMFDTGWLGGTHIDSAISSLATSAKHFRKEDFGMCPFDNDEIEGIIALLALGNTVDYGCFTWRGQGGNYRSDPRFDAELGYTETDETKLRMKFIKALEEYSTNAAAWAKDMGCDESKKLFLSVLSTLAANTKPDPEYGIGRNLSERIVTDFVMASKLLWEEWQAELVRKGVILSKADEKQLADEIEESLIRIEKIADKAIRRCQHYNAGKQTDRQLVMEAIGNINDELEDVFMPAVLKYSKSEEADPYDETRIACAVLPLCERLFDKESSHYRHCAEKANEMNEQLAFPIDHHDPAIWSWTDPIDKAKKFIPQGWMDLNSTIAESLDIETEKEDLLNKVNDGKEQLDRIEMKIDSICDNDAKPRKRSRKRGQGTSEISGNVNHYKRIYVEQGKFVKVNKTKYPFVGSDQWEIIDRFLTSLRDGDNHDSGHFPVKFTSCDFNKCKGKCRTLINDFIERQQVAKRIRNKKFEGYARFRIELLK